MVSIEVLKGDIVDFKRVQELLITLDRKIKELVEKFENNKKSIVVNQKMTEQYKAFILNSSTLFTNIIWFQ